MGDSKKPIVLRWETLVFVSNLIPLVGCLWVLWRLPSLLGEGPIPLIQTVILFPLVASACYCFGPLLRICVSAEPGEDAVDPGRRAVVLWWEKLRFVYNLILLVEGLFLLGEDFVSAFARFWMLMTMYAIMFAIVANACYCLGPLFEICFQFLLKRRVGRARYLLFSVGLLFSVEVLYSMWRAGVWALQNLPKD